jgi:hypothetical protein
MFSTNCFSAAAASFKVIILLQQLPDETTDTLFAELALAPTDAAAAIRLNLELCRNP